MKTKRFDPLAGNAEAGFRDLLDGANDLIFILSPDARFLYSNRAFQTALGYSEPELRAFDIFAVIPTKLRMRRFPIANSKCCA